jgi:hypothetical protein
MVGDKWCWLLCSWVPVNIRGIIYIFNFLLLLTFVLLSLFFNNKTCRSDSFYVVVVSRVLSEGALPIGTPQTWKSSRPVFSTVGFD